MVNLAIRFGKFGAWLAGRAEPISGRTVAACLVGAALCLVAAAGNALVQRAGLFATTDSLSRRENARPMPEFGAATAPWGLVCADPAARRTCLVQSDRTVDGARAIAEIGFANPQGGSRALIFRVLLPLGLDLRLGVSFEMPEVETFVAIPERCGGAGCVVSFQPSEALWMGLREARDLSVVWRDHATGAVHVKDVPGRGLATALAVFR
jgi:invasion protein IalB